MKMRKILLGFAAGAAALALAACSGGGGGESDGDEGGVEHLKVAVYGSTEESVIDIAEREGWFAEAGIEVEKVIIGAPPAVVAAAQSGEVDVALVPSVLVVRGIAEGVPLTIVGAVDGYPAENPEDYDSGPLLTSPDSGITSVGDLEGATIAVSARGSMFEVKITNLLLQSGVDPESINWVTMDFATSLPALEDGTIDAAPMISPMSEDAIKRGMVVLGYPGAAFFPEVPVDLWVASPDVIEKRGDAIRAFRDATYRAAQWANEHEDEVKELGVEIGQVDVDPQELKPMHFITEVDVDALERLNERMIEMGFLENRAEFVVLD